MKLTTAALSFLGVAVIAAAGPPARLDPYTIHVFYQDQIHFTPDEPARYDTPRATASENGREITRMLDLGMQIIFRRNLDQVSVCRRQRQ